MTDRRPQHGRLKLAERCFGVVLTEDSAAAGEGVVLQLPGLLVLTQGSPPMTTSPSMPRSPPSARLFGGMGKPVDRDGYSDHFPIGVEVAEDD